jgi:Mrp family chromosome partitioning ATPase
MSKYFQALQRSESTTVVRQTAAIEDLLQPPFEDNREPPRPVIGVPVPAVDGTDLIGALAHDPSLGRLAEQLAARGTPENPVHLLVTGCRAGDGASTLAVALALDLSQRLTLRTVLVDGHLRNPGLHNLLAQSAPMPADLTSATSVSTQRTAWPRLDLISRAPILVEPSKAVLDDFSGLLRRYPIAVIDMGVIRLEPRMLAMARPNDLILIVTRYLHTERQELLSTAGVLRGTNHTVTGVILNGFKSAVPGFIRRYLGFGG